jgi:O-antigen/teichoic acid export membrane protein
MSLFYFQIISFVLSLIGYVLMARQFGAAAFGSVFAALAIASVLIDLLDFGRCTWICREIAASRANLNHAILLLRKVENRFLVLAVPTSIIFVGIYKDLSVAPIFIYPIAWLIVNYMQSYLIASKKFKDAGILLFVEKVIAFAIVLFSIHQGYSSLLALSFVVVLPVFAHAFISVLYGAKLLQVDSKLRDSEDFLKLNPGKHLDFGVRSITTDLLQLEIPIAKLLLDPISAGVFAMIMKFRSPMSIGFNFIVSLTSPLITSKDFRNLSEIYKKLLLIALLNLIAIILFAVTLNNSISTKIFGNDFLLLQNAALPMVLTFFFWSIFNVSTSWQVAMGEEKYVRKLTIYVIVFHLVVLFFLCKYTSLEIVSWSIFIEMMLVGLYVSRSVDLTIKSNLGIKLRLFKC